MADMPVSAWQTLVTQGFIRRATRFGLSGLLITALHIVVATSLIETILPVPALANGIAFVIATLTSYMINTVWSFSQTPKLSNLGRFVAVAIAGLLITMGLTGLVAHFGFSYWVGILCAVFVVPPTTFMLHLCWTYR